MTDNAHKIYNGWTLLREDENCHIILFQTTKKSNILKGQFYLMNLHKACFKTALTILDLVVRVLPLHHPTTLCFSLKKV